MKGDHLWRVLISKGFFVDKDEAVRWILAGKVLVNGERINNSGVKTSFDAQIKIKGFDQRYVGRGGEKLEGALKDLSIDVSDCIVLDAGASHGGFTDCLLKHGALLVYAVDAGFGQLAGSLRSDPRVVNMEKTNIGDLSPGRLNPVPSIATVDLSYLSLKKAVPTVANLIGDEGALISLVKPLFETQDAQSRRSGTIQSAGVFVDILSDLINFMRSEGLFPVDIVQSRIKGSKGTVEFFLHISKKPIAATGDMQQRIYRAVYGA